MRPQHAEYRLGVLGKRTFQFAYFPIIRPPEQVIAPDALLLVEQRQNMLEQRQGFRGDSGSIAQRLIQALTSLALPAQSADRLLRPGAGSCFQARKLSAAGDRIFPLGLASSIRSGNS